MASGGNCIKYDVPAGIRTRARLPMLNANAASCVLWSVTLGPLDQAKYSEEILRSDREISH